MPIAQHQRGVALITALLVVSLATMLAVSLIEHLYFDIRRTGNILRLDQAHLFNDNAVDFGMSLLRLDRNKNNNFDNLQEYSNSNEQIFPVDGGTVSAKILDLQGCFNLNNLSKTNPDLEKQRGIYRKLLQQLNLPNSNVTELVDSLVDWLDSDDLTEPYGAEFDYYIGLLKPYRTANGLMVTPSELSLVKGYNKEVLNVLNKYTCVLPETNSAININTASLEMLESLPGLEGQGSTIIGNRDGEASNPDDDTSYENINNFKSYVQESLEISNLNTAGLQVFSEYFLIQSRTQLGAGNVRLYSVIHRDQSNGKTTIIQQARGAL